MALNIFYVYQYINELGKIYYIGKGSKDRINESHAPYVTLPAKENRKYIAINLSEEAAFELEISLIKKYGRKLDGGILDNKKLTRWVAQSGWHHSDESKQKISKNNTGKVRTTAQRENYKGANTPEHIENVRQAVKKLWEDPIYKAQRLAKLKEKPAAHKGRPWSQARRDAQMKKQNNKGLPQ